MLAGDTDGLWARDSWVGRSAVRIATAVQRGEASATRVLVDHLDHADVADALLGVLRQRRDVVACAEAELVDEQPDPGGLPLAGVPVLISENTPVVGLATGRGSTGLPGAVAVADHEVVRRLRGAGAVVLGTARISELGLWATTDDDQRLTRHPWRPDRSPGGACGGAAAAVAAGVVPIAHGTDGLGSVRIPAACCGLVGLTPGRGLTDWYGLAEHGVLATTVEDAALGFQVMAGRPHRPVRDPARLRIGVSARSPVPLLGPDLDVRAALTLAARLTVGLGHDVVEADPAYPPRLARMAMGAWSSTAYLDGPGDPALRDPEGAGHPGGRPQRRTRGLAGLGGLALRHGLVRAGERLDWQDRCVAWFTRWGLDALVVPAIAGGPPALGPWSGRGLAVNAAGWIRLSAYTIAWSLAGFPAVVVPMGVRRDGLPGSVQLVGPPGAEARLLALAAQLERVNPWRRHGPGWPRRRVVRPSAHDGAGDPGRRHGRAQGAGSRRADDPPRAEPAVVYRVGRAGVAQV